MANKNIKEVMKNNHISIEQVASAMFMDPDVLKESLQKELASDSSEMVMTAIKKVLGHGKKTHHPDFHHELAKSYNAAVRNNLVLTSELNNGNRQVGVPFYANGIPCVRLG